LQKLLWYSQGGQPSDRQWRDVVAIATVPGKRLDGPYLMSTAAAEGLTDLLERVWREAAGR
jgi:hypothetical protein